MSERVSADQIEQIVGVPRHQTAHYARAVSVEQIVYILHSSECLVAEHDLRDCDFSAALDRGIDVDQWQQDCATRVEVRGGCLVPDTKDGT